MIKAGGENNIVEWSGRIKKDSREYSREHLISFASCPKTKASFAKCEWPYPLHPRCVIIRKV